jgi:hypothetical protein
MIVGLVALSVVVGACGGGSGSGHAAGSGHSVGSSTTVSTRATPVTPTTTQTPQAARANARCVLGNDAVSAIMGAPYGPPRLEPSAAGKACRYEAASGNGSVVVTLRVGATAADFAADRQPFDLAGAPTRDWNGIADGGFTDVNGGGHSVTAGALAGNVEVVASAMGAGSIANVEDLVRTALAILINGS